jgi:hypothetical protein
MGRIRRYGYIIEWFTGDHVPRHVHVYDRRGSFLGRLDVVLGIGVEGWVPDRRLLKLIEELRKEGRL